MENAAPKEAGTPSYTLENPFAALPGKEASSGPTSIYEDSLALGEELIAETLALTRTTHEARDVDDLNHRWNHLLGRNIGLNGLQPGIRYRHDANVRLDCAEGVIGTLSPGCGEGVEQS